MQAGGSFVVMGKPKSVPMGLPRALGKAFSPTRFSFHQGPFGESVFRTWPLLTPSSIGIHLKHTPPEGVVKKYQLRPESTPVVYVEGGEQVWGPSGHRTSCAAIPQPLLFPFWCFTKGLQLKTCCTQTLAVPCPGESQDRTRRRRSSAHPAR